MKVFVTGGAGYIGSHTVKALGEAGHEILVYDNLSTGNRWAVLHGELVEADLADTVTLEDTLRRFSPDVVIHFAAKIIVPESVSDPISYYRNNVSNTFNLLWAMRRTDVGKIVFSSTATAYGIVERTPITEDTPLNPINPYGMTKVMSERCMEDLAAADEGFSYVSLRYFNVAGADPEGRIGQAYSEATHLITRALKVVSGEIDHLDLFGTDYPTPDGTCVRDYVHVDDLAAAHLLAMDWLSSGGGSRVFNCGYGRGFSVRDVIRTIRDVTGSDFPVVETSRREGDPPTLVADTARIQKELGFSPRHDDLEFIIRTAWQWEQAFASRKHSR